MPRDHYIPASFIGRFSISQALPARKRPVARAVATWTEARVSSAESFGFSNNLYSIEDDRSVDEIWSYETELPPLLDKLCRADQIPLQEWLDVLVPWATSLFIRGQEFDSRYRARRPNMPAQFMNPNGGRVMEFQRLLAPVTVARWAVFHGRVEMLNNDLGLAFQLDARTGRTGWAIPVGRRTVLGLFPVERRSVGMFRDGRWQSIIEHEWRDDAYFDTLNAALVNSAGNFAYAAQARTLERYLPHDMHAPSTDTFVGWPFTGSELRNVELEWHRLTSITRSGDGPADLDVDSEIQFENLPDRWKARLVLGVNAPPPFRDLRIQGSTLRMSMRPRLGDGARPSMAQRRAGPKWREEFGVYDLAAWDPAETPEPPMRRIILEVTMREHVLDEWAKADRYLRAAASYLVAEAENALESGSTAGPNTWTAGAEPYWQDISTVPIQDVLDTLEEFLIARNTPAPIDFRRTLLDLHDLRDLLANNESGPIPEDPLSGVRVMVPIQYGRALYETVSNDEMLEKSERASEASQWLETLFPEIARERAQSDEPIVTDAARHRHRDEGS